MANRKRKTVGAATREVEATNEVETAPMFWDDANFWFGAAAIVLLAAAFLRFYDLSLVPFHHDEGVNGFFLVKLARENVYQYDPSNYHGPTLYFFALVSSLLFGLNDFAVRFVPALFGLLCVWLALGLRRQIGAIGALTAAALIALSPGLVYVSRYFIHELPFVFFTFAAVVCVVKFIERERVDQIAVGALGVLLLVCLLPGALNFANAVAGDNDVLKTAARLAFILLAAILAAIIIRLLLDWNNGKFIYLLLAAASAALTFATKETAFISFGTILIAVAGAVSWQIVRHQTSGANNDEKLTWRRFVAAFDGANNAFIVGALCLVLFAYVWALFFLSFFHYGDSTPAAFAEGLGKSFEAYSFWTKTGNKDHTQNGPWAYLKWGLKLESMLFVAAAIGAVVAFVKGRNRFAVFVALWAFGLFAAYTIIPYKTPWLAVNFLLPMGLIAGYGVNELVASKENWQRAFGFLIIIAGVGVGAWQTLEFNFKNYDDNSQPYVYAHSTRPTFDLLQDIDRVAAASGKNKDAAILIAAPEYWPLPWYLRDYKSTAFYGQIYPSSTSEMIIGSTNQSAELEAEYAAHYTEISRRELRPGVTLILYARQDLADKLLMK